MKKLRWDYVVNWRAWRGGFKITKKHRAKCLDGEVQISTNKQCGIEARMHDKRYTWENEIMKFISLYKDLMHSSYLMAAIKKGHHQTFPPSFRKNRINKQKHGKYSKLFNE